LPGAFVLPAVFKSPQFIREDTLDMRAGSAIEHSAVGSFVFPNIALRLNQGR
jgi:hypothetical protein